MKSIIKVFLDKQKDKNFFQIIIEIIVRCISLFLFPFVWLMLYLINLFYNLKIGFLYHERLGHLAHNTDLFLRRKSKNISPNNCKYIFFVYNPANKQLVKMFKRKINLIESELLSKLFAPIGFFKTRYYQPLPFIGNEYFEYTHTNVQLEFTKKEIEKGNNFLRSIGIGKNDWYVCVFARDHAYYKNFSKNVDLKFTDHRNADINTYELAIKFVISKGGYVIRMGSHIENELSFKDEKLIDYAKEYRDDFLDVFLSANCKFYVGNASGALDLAVIFDIPVVGVNWMPIGYAPFGKNSIYIPKNIHFNNANTPLKFKDRLNLFIGNQVGANLSPEEILESNGLKLIDNTDEEILQVVVEMYERINGIFIINDEYNKLVNLYFEQIPDNNIYKNTKTPLGKEYMKKLYEKELF